MFVVFEGGEGCGKSTQASLLAQELGKHGKDCLLTREPGGTPLAESIRALFKEVQAHGDEPTPLAELHLVMAARAQHVAKVVIPALSAGRVVLCDRFLDSSHVYQGARGGLERSVINDAARPILGPLVPDLTFVLHVPVSVALERMAKRTSAPGPTDRLDSLGSETLAAIATAFLELARNEVPYPSGAVPHRIVIDASRSADAVFAEILAETIKTLSKKETAPR